MGSTGYGKFGNYPHLTDGKTNGAGGAGGIVLSDSCPAELILIKLEDIAHFDFYKTYNTVPKVDDTVLVSKEITNGRIVVIHEQENKTIGSIPTEYNKYVNCFTHYTYTGIITNSGIFPIPYIIVTLKNNG